MIKLSTEESYKKMEENILITEEMLTNAGFECLELLDVPCRETHFELYGTKNYKVFRKWTNDKYPIKLDVDNGKNNSNTMWHLHIDNCDCNTIGCADINYIWQINKLMEVFGSNFRIACGKDELNMLDFSTPSNNGGIDYEKKYKEAVSEIGKLRDMLIKEGVINVDGVVNENFERIFPELKEPKSKDEIIRNWLIGYFNQYKIDDMEQFANGLKVDDIIDWLERKKHRVNVKGYSEDEWKEYFDDFDNNKPVDKVEQKFKEGDKIRNKNTGDTATVTTVNEDGKYYLCKGFDGAGTKYSDFRFGEECNWEIL